MSLYQNIINLLQKNNIQYQEFDHDPILSYEDAERERKKFNWQGVESKNVFMKGKDGNYYVFLTIAGQKVDFEKLKELIGTRCSIASHEDVENIIKCVPGCVIPFGFAENITIIIDPQIFDHNQYLFSPGQTDKTIQINPNDLKIIFEKLSNKIFFF